MSKNHHFSRFFFFFFFFFFFVALLILVFCELVSVVILFKINNIPYSCNIKGTYVIYFL